MTVIQPARPGEWFDNGLGLDDIAPGRFRMDITTDRYIDPDYVQRERDHIWLRVWQVAGRESDLPEFNRIYRELFAHPRPSRTT